MMVGLIFNEYYLTNVSIQVNIDTSGQVKLKVKSERAIIDHAKIRLVSPNISFKFDNSSLVENGKLVLCNFNSD